MSSSHAYLSETVRQSGINAPEDVDHPIPDAQRGQAHTRQVLPRARFLIRTLHNACFPPSLTGALWLLKHVNLRLSGRWEAGPRAMDKTRITIINMYAPPSGQSVRRQHEKYWARHGSRTTGDTARSYQLCRTHARYAPWSATRCCACGCNIPRWEIYRVRVGCFCDFASYRGEPASQRARLAGRSQLDGKLRLSFGGTRTPPMS
jgi:hypothetical protein